MIFKQDVLLLVTTYHEMLKDLVDGTCTRRSRSEHKTAAAATGSDTCDGRRRRFDERQRVISKRRYATKRTLFRLDSSIKNALAQVPPPPPP